MIEALTTAFRTLTIIPIPTRISDNFQQSVEYFPVVGAAIGISMSVIAKYLMFWTHWHIGGAVLLICFDIFITRGIHLDGLADFADGFGGGFTKERVLDIMKDSRVGSFGVLSLIMISLVKFAGFDYILQNSEFALLIPLYTISRWSMSELSSSLPYARKKGGTARVFVEHSQKKTRIIALLYMSIIVIPFNTIGIALIVVGFFSLFLLGRLFIRRIGGVTGDLLGASAEITLGVMLLFVCLFYKYLPAIKL